MSKAPLHHAKSESSMKQNVLKTSTRTKKTLKRMITRTPADGSYCTLIITRKSSYL